MISEAVKADLTAAEAPIPACEAKCASTADLVAASRLYTCCALYPAPKAASNKCGDTPASDDVYPGAGRPISLVGDIRPCAGKGGDNAPIPNNKKKKYLIYQWTLKHQNLNY